MKIVDQEVQDVIQVPDNPEATLKHIEKIGRICYQSQDKITKDSCVKFVKMLFDRNHWAMLENSWLVVQGEISNVDDVLLLYETLHNSFIKVFFKDGVPLLCGNYRAWYESGLIEEKSFEIFRNLPKEIVSSLKGIGLNFKELTGKNIPKEHRAYSVILKTDRAVTHELVRHRPASFAQESQRYCAYRDELEFIMPYYFRDQNDRMGGFFVWKELMSRIEEDYQFSLRIGQKPQEARSMLPNSTATQITVTADLKEWEHIFKLRCAPDAYPMIKRLMTEVRTIFEKKKYLIGE